MLRALRRLRPHAVHISTPGPVGLVGLAAAKLLSRERPVRILGVYHTDFPAYVERLFADPSFSWLSRLSMCGFYSGFDRIFTRSDEYAEAVESLGVSRGRIVRLRPGIDTSAFDPCFRDDSGALWAGLGLPARAAQELKVLYAGRVSVEKDLPLLVRAWLMVRERMRGSGLSPQLIVAGDGPYRAEMERALAGHDAHFLGFQGAALPAIYASCDLFAFPSTTDTLGQVVMEAQASGLAVLVSDRGGPREVVQDGVSGLVLPSGDASRWASAMARLLSDDGKRMQMARAAHEAMRPMSIEASFEHFWSVHEEACGAEGGITPAS
jgi:glycosyltransferase involved in cell wall biosynthesis